MKTGFKHFLLASATSSCITVTGAANAQQAVPPVATSDVSPKQQSPVPVTNGVKTSSDPDGGTIIVTGSILRTSKETASPVTVLSSASLEQRGITNIADAVRSVSADNSGSIPTAFSNGFGSGSAAVSLRGLTVNSTLTLIDGMRTVNYPYADDGQRSFVDLNTIPRSTIDRIEVLKDGASSTYGADAIGGVVNIIMRKQIKGIEATAEAGVSKKGDGGEQRLTLTSGWGDLNRQGFNVYINGEYEKDGLIQARDRRFPYNTADLTSIGGDNNNYGAFGAFGARNSSTTAVVQPAMETVAGDIFSGVAVVDPSTVDPVSGGGLPFATQLVNPAGGCGESIARSDSTGAFCEYNPVSLGTLQPLQKRYGLTAHATFRVAERSEAYLTGTWYHSDVFSTAAPFTVRQRNPINTTNVVLPALLANGSVNPYDPYAVAGCIEAVSCVDAQLAYNFGTIPSSFTSKNNVYRVAGGIHGRFEGGWSYQVDVTYARSSLKGINRGYINIAGLTKAINTGSFNFANPSATPQSVLDAISPDAITSAKGELYGVQGSISKELFSLPGGPLSVGVGGSVRHERLNNPNANANNAFLGLNAVSAAGKHWVEAGYFEVDAPFTKQIDINASGRFDHYSEGYSHFSPKIGVKFTPVRQLALRGTYSKGFRAPTFAEIAQGAVIGFTNATPPCSVIIQHGGTGTADSCSGGDAYVKAYSLGYNTASNPNIKPELSRSFTAGAVFQPTRWLSLTADYYNIKKTRVISGGPLSGQAISAYYAGTTLPVGYTVSVDDPDPAFPNGTRKVLIVNAPYANAAALKTSGLDFEATGKFRFGPNVRFTSAVEVTDIFKYNFKPSADQPYDHYVGTQAPYILSSGAGTPKWRGNWQNTLEAGRLTLSATAYYTSGYKSVAEDQNGHGATTCADNLYDPSLFVAGSTSNHAFFCHTKRFIDVDAVATIKVTDRFEFYMNVLNVLNAKAPLNPANYAGAGANYNPTWTQQGIIGRFYRAGVNIKLGGNG